MSWIVLVSVVVLAVEGACVLRPLGAVASGLNLAARLLLCVLSWRAGQSELAALFLVGVGVHGARCAQLLERRLLPDESGRVDVV